MNKQAINLLFLTTVTTLVISCSDSNTPDANDNKRVDEKSVSIQETTDTGKENRYCYRNDYPFPNEPKYKDVLELNIQIVDNMVTGSYNWLPEFKDQRKGQIEGTIKDNRIKGKYVFMQEGVKDSAEITITLKDKFAVVEGNPLGLGLSSSVTKISCNN